jgi:monoamine oxidase
MSRAAPGMLRRHREGLTAGQREDRSADKRNALSTAWLVPDVFVGEGEWCLPPLSVAVIGGGFSGLSAAWYLHQCGAAVTVYEASNRLGGRVFSDRAFIPGKIVEAGAELIGENHPLWGRLASDFGLRLVELTGEDEYERRGLRMRLRMAGHTLTPAEMDALERDLLPHFNRIGREARPIDPTAPWLAANARRLDRMTVKDKLDLMLGTGTSHVRQWFEFVLGNDDCAPVSRQSYLAFLAQVSAGRMGDDEAGMRGYWDSTETHRCAEGNDALATRIAARLPEGAVRLGRPVTQIDVELDLIPPVRIFSTGAPASGESFDFAILTVPPSRWGQITFNPGFPAAERSIQHGPAIKYLTSYADKFWERAGLAPSALWDELGSVWESTDAQPPGTTGFGLSVFSGGDHVLSGGAPEYATKLATFFPGGTVTRAELVDWTVHPTIRAGYAVPGRNQVTTAGRRLLEPHRRRLHFAGEQTSMGFFGYMEGALQTGARAARDIVRSWMVRCDGTVFAGSGVRRIRGDDYAVVTIGRMFPGPPPTIAGLARALHLQTDITFHALLGYRANAPAVRALYRDQIGEPVPADLAEARRALTVEGTSYVASHQFPEGTETPYVCWPVLPDGDEPVVLPLSPGFRDVMAEAVRERRRQTRLDVIQPQLDALAVELDAIRAQARRLSESIETCRILGERHATEVAILEALDGLLGALLAAPKAPPSAGDVQEVQRLRGQLAALRAEAHRHMLLEPAESFRAGLVARRDAEARELLALVESPPFVEHVRTLAANRDIAPVELYAETNDVSGFAFQALLASPQSEAALTRHVLPMIDALASRQLDLTGLAATTNPDLDRAIRDVPAAPAADSVLTVLVGVSGALPLAVGNYPGPNTLAVGVLQWAAPVLLARLAGDRAGAVRMAGWLYRALVTCASVRAAAATGIPQPLSLAERVALLEAIDRGDLARLRAVNWSARFQASPAWGAAIAVASAICLYAAVQSDDASTLRRWSNVMGSASGTALGVSVALGRYSTLVQRGIVTGVAGRALGVIGGAAALVSGVVTAEEEYHSGDTVGMWVAIGGATAGALSVAGFLLSAGAATTATVAGAPVGVVLMVAGAVLGIGAGVVAVVRSLLTAGSQVVFETMLAHFGRAGGPYEEAAAVRPSLRAAYTAVQGAQHSVDFWDVHPDRTPELFDLGYAAAHIVEIVDESEENVQNRLRVAGRVER